jgi:hypothetical protein
VTADRADGEPLGAPAGEQNGIAADMAGHQLTLRNTGSGNPGSQIRAGWSCILTSHGLLPAALNRHSYAARSSVVQWGQRLAPTGIAILQ